MPRPAPLSYLQNFPTPNIGDFYVVESYNKKGSRYPLEYGTAHPDQRIFPGFILTKQMDQDETWATMIYARDRVGQAEYNFTVKFSGDSNAHPIYTRAYILRRQGYAPTEKLTVDPLFRQESGDVQPVLVEEEMRQCEDDNISSLYVMVIRVYESLDGPIITGVQTDPETNVQYPVSRQYILADADIPANGGGIVYEKEPVSTTKAILVTRDLSPLIGVHYETFPNISYLFPGLLTFRGGLLSETRQPASYRSAFSRLIRARVDTYYTVEPEDHSDDIFEPYTVNVRSDGGNFGSVLHNIRSSIIGGKRQRVEPSFPSSTEYPIGEEVLIRAPSERGENALYKNELTFIFLL